VLRFLTLFLPWSVRNCLLTVSLGDAIQACESLCAFSLAGFRLRHYKTEAQPKTLCDRLCTIIKTSHWLSDAIHVKQNDLIIRTQIKYYFSLDSGYLLGKTYLFSQMNKSAVLKKATDHIKNLRNTNNRLKQENVVLRLTLNKLGVNVDDILSAAPSPGK